MKTIIMPCGCNHEYQIRDMGRECVSIMKPQKKPTGAGGWVCTVCGKAKSK